MTVGSKSCYCRDGKALTGEQYVDSAWYYLDPDATTPCRPASRASRPRRTPAPSRWPTT